MSSDKNVLLFEHGNEEAEHLFVAQSILSLEVPKNEIFVLARTNKQLDKIAETLRKFKVDFIKRTIEEQKPDIEPKENQITLSTIHAIKGLEAEVVYLIGANNFNFPCRASEHPILDILKTNDGYDKYEEELRVFYVALSRAKSKLIINHYSTLTHFVDDRTKRIIDEQENKEEIRRNNKEEFLGNKLFNILKKWRLEKSKELNVMAFQILSDRTLIEICQNRPTAMEGLFDINGIGPSKASRFGEEILKIVFENS